MKSIEKLILIKNKKSIKAWTMTLSFPYQTNKQEKIIKQRKF
jgi:hypothetical protein